MDIRIAHAYCCTILFSINNANDSCVVRKIKNSARNYTINFETNFVQQGTLEFMIQNYNIIFRENKLRTDIRRVKARFIIRMI